VRLAWNESCEDARAMPVKGECKNTMEIFDSAVDNSVVLIDGPADVNQTKHL